MSRKTQPNKNTVTLALPEEFLALCASDGVAPELVLRGFIADLSEIMDWASNHARTATAATAATSGAWPMSITSGWAIRGGTRAEPGRARQMHGLRPCTQQAKGFK